MATTYRFINKGKRHSFKYRAATSENIATIIIFADLCPEMILAIAYQRKVEYEIRFALSLS